MVLKSVFTEYNWQSTKIMTHKEILLFLRDSFASILSELKGGNFTSYNLLHTSYKAQIVPSRVFLLLSPSSVPVIEILARQPYGKEFIIIS